jgi:hypothetical protein
VSVATSTAIGIGAAVSAGAGIAGSAISSHAQGSATDKAVNAEQTSSANTLAFNRDVFNTTQANEQPFLNLGQGAAAELGSKLADGSLTSAYPGGPFSFSGVNEANDPAYQFNVQQGTDAIQKSAAARGGLVSGGALRDLSQWSQGYGMNQYQQSYTNALAAYQQAYSQFQDTNANTFSRLMGAAQLGQGAASGTAAAGSAAAGTAAGVSGSTANSLANLYTGQANAQTGAIAAGTNAVSSGVNQYANYLAQQQMMSGSSYNPAVMVPYTPTYPVDPRTGI